MRETARLALPIVVVQVGLMLMGVVDTLMVGRVSAVALAAVALAHLYFIAVAIGGMGTLLALDPIVAQAVGAGEPVSIARALQRGLLIATGIAAATALVLVPGEWLLTFFRQPPEVIPLAARYARALIPGTLPFFVFIVLRQTLQALGLVRPIVVTIIAGNVLNALLNWVLIYGHLGAPALGPMGSAYSTTLSRWAMAVALLALTRKALLPYLHPARRDALALVPLRRMLRLGLPVGAQNFLEVLSFGAVVIMMGWLGTAELGGHEIAINLAAFTFMVPLGVGGAASVLVGQAIGRGDIAAARREAGAALVWGVGFMCATAVLFLAFPRRLAETFTADQEVVAVAAALIPLAGVFQIFDGTQAVSAGILRGTGDTRAPLLSNLVGFALIGLPVSYWLGFHAGLGPAGLWWGLVVGLSIVAVFLILRVRARLRRHIARVVIDEYSSGVIAPSVSTTHRDADACRR
jgi:MATE family multidrug resistance protein